MLTKGMLLRTLIILLVFFLLASVVFLQGQYTELKKEQDTILLRMDNRSQDMTYLEERLNGDLNDEEYIRRVAREELGLCSPDEMIYTR